MQKAQTRLTIALLFTALAVLTFFGTVFISSTIDFLYRDASGLSSVRSVAQIAALLTGAVLWVAGLIVAVPIALQPGKWYRKLLYALPAFLLGFVLAAVLSSLLGVGTVGTLFNLQGIGSVTFSAAWLAVAGVVSTLAVVVAAARTRLAASVVRLAVQATTLASVLLVVAAIAMLASVAIVSANQPASFGPGGGGPGGFPGGGQPPANVPSGGFAQPEATSEAPNGGPNGQNAGAPGGNFAQPEATGEVPSGRPNGQNTGGEGGFPPPGGGGPGGPGGSSANVVSRYSIGAGLMALFAVIAVGSAVSALYSLRQPITSADRVTIVNPGREAGSAVLACIGLGVIVIGVSQVVTVPHDNPPVQTPITWDSEQTRQLVYSTCMDCHSNETTWPWYSYIAPSSWLTSLHVRDGRQQLNLSEMDSMPAFQRANVAENMANQIRSGSMPPKDYLILHPDARLTDEQKEQLIQGLEASLSGQ